MEPLEINNRIIDSVKKSIDFSRCVVFPVSKLVYGHSALYPENIEYAKKQGLQVLTYTGDSFPKVIIGQDVKISDVISNDEASVFFNNLASFREKESSKVFFLELFSSIKQKTYTEAVSILLEQFKQDSFNFEQKGIILALQFKLTELAVSSLNGIE